MRRIIAAAICCLGLSLPNVAQAQTYRTSFNCGTADRPDEVLICHSRELAALDVEMSDAYFEIRNSLHGARRAEIEADQTRWLKSRIDCGGDHGCIDRAYRRRIRQLNHDY